MGLGYFPSKLPVNEDMSLGLDAWISFAAQRVPSSTVMPSLCYGIWSGRKEFSKPTTDQEEEFLMLYTLVDIDEVFYIFIFIQIWSELQMFQVEKEEKF